MSMIHSSIIPFDPLLTDVLLWTTERTCYACYTISYDSLLLVTITILMIPPTVHGKGLLYIVCRD